MIRVPFYELQFFEEIGVGGFGVAYRGSWRDDEVAIKVLPLQQLSPVDAAQIHAEMAMIREE
jgi:predicted Ser/Thr protein kinase